MLATGSQPGDFFFTANPFTVYDYDHYLFHIIGYTDSLIMPFGMETTCGVWYDQGLNLLILLRDQNDDNFTFSWDGGNTVEPGPEIYNLTFEVSLFPGEAALSSSWTVDTLNTWHIGECIGRPSSGTTYNKQCTAWNPGEAMSIFYFPSVPDSHYIYHSYDYSNYFDLSSVTTELPGCIYLTRGFSQWEMYSLYGGQIYRTLDYGQTWEWANSLYYSGMFFGVYLESGWAPGELLIMYWEYYIDSMVEVYRSADYGSNWELLWDTEQLSVENNYSPPRSASLDFKVWPNPTNGQIQLSLPLSTGGYLTLYDILGRRVLSRNIENGTKTLQLKLDGLPGGIYLLEFENAAKEKFIQKAVLIK